MIASVGDAKMTSTELEQLTPSAGRRERDQNLVLAVGAPKAGEASRQVATAQELAQLPLDEAREPVAAAAQMRLGQEGLKVLADYLVQYRVLRPAAHVGGACAPEPIVASQRVRVCGHVGQRGRSPHASSGELVQFANLCSWPSSSAASARHGVLNVSTTASPTSSV